MLIDIPTFTEYMYNYLIRMPIQESEVAIPDIYFYSDNGGEVIYALADKLYYSRLGHLLQLNDFGDVFIKEGKNEEVYCYFDGNYGDYMIDIVYITISRVAYVNFCKDKDKFNHIIQHGVDEHEYFYNPHTKEVENRLIHRNLIEVRRLKGGN